MSGSHGVGALACDALPAGLQARQTEVQVTVELVTDCKSEDWNRFVESSVNAEIYHLYEWRHIFEQVFNNDCYYLIARGQSGDVQGLLPLVHLKSWIFGNFLVSVPCFNYCGILSDQDIVRNELLRAAKRQADCLGAGHIELRHRDHFKLDLPFRDEKVSMQLTLPETAKDLWKSFKPKLRAQIKRPQKEGAECIDGGIELLNSFYKVFSQNMRDLGTPVFPKALFGQMCERFPASTRIFVVNLRGQPVAAGITIGYRQMLEIPSASSLREFNRYSVNMLLYWSVLKYAIGKGYRQFDFGRSTVDAGTYRFKKQWGAVPKQLMWHYSLAEGVGIPVLNPANPRFKLATALWRRMPLWAANSLGPHIVRNLP